MWRNNPDPHSNFLREAPVHALQCVLYELYESYQRFFRGEQVHPPQFKNKSKANISFTESDPATFEIEEARKRVRLPKLGWVKCRFPRHIEGQPNSVTVQWNGVCGVLSVQSKVEIADQTHPSDTIVAGDKQIWAGGLVEYQSEAYSSQQCPACEYTSPLNRKRQEAFACVSPTCGFRANADEVAAQNQLKRFLSSNKGLALLASGYRASVNSLPSGRSWDSTMKQEPIEDGGTMCPTSVGNLPRSRGGGCQSEDVWRRR